MRGSHHCRENGGDSIKIKMSCEMYRLSNQRSSLSNKLLLNYNPTNQTDDNGATHGCQLHGVCVKPSNIQSMQRMRGIIF